MRTSFIAALLALAPMSAAFAQSLPSPTVNSLTANTLAGDGSAGVKATATGATSARAMADRAADALSVKDFGAKCDGSTNDAAAFQAAASLGRLIRVPAGICRINATITPVNGTRFVGAGRPQQFSYQPPMAGTVLDFVGAPAGADGFGGASSAVQMFGLSDLQIERAPRHGINLPLVQSHIERVTVAYNGGDGFNLPNTYLTTISGSLTEFNGGNGLTSTGSGQYTTLAVINSEASHNTGDGWQVTKMNSTSFVSTGADQNGGYGYNGINSDLGFYSTDAESNGLSGYRLYGSYARFDVGTAAANNTTNTANEANFLKAENASNATISTSKDLASTTAYSLSALTSSQISTVQSTYQSGRYTDGGSAAIASVTEPLLMKATSNIGFVTGASNFALYGDAGNTILNAPTSATLGFRVGNTSVGSATTGGWSLLGPVTLSGSVSMAASTSIAFATGSNAYALYGDASNTLLNVPAGGAISFRTGGTEVGYATASAWVFKQLPHPPAYTVATLPTCNTTNRDGIAVVTDATAPTYRGALTGGGTARALAYCDGASWMSH
jgi:hypothetical protein